MIAPHDDVGLVAGRYRVGRTLGRGGAAEVVEAVDERTGRSVALKLLHRELSDAARWDAFFEEVRAVRAVGHPGVPTIYDWGVDPGTPPQAWIAMQLVAGATLAQCVRDRGRLAPGAAAVVADALLAVVEAAHAQSVVHRDITPSNVMLDPDADGDAALAASVRLLDFGLADIPGRPASGGDVLLSAAAHDPSRVIASVPYASPEQLRGAPVGEAADLYQLSATLFMALTGTTLFAGDVSAQRDAHIAAPPPSLSDRGLPGLESWDAVLQTALRKSPSRRFADAGEMRRALRTVLSESAPAQTARTGHGDDHPGSDDRERTRVLMTLGPPPEDAIPRGGGSTPPGSSGGPTTPPAVRSPGRGAAGFTWGAVIVGAAVITGIVTLAAMTPRSAPATVVTAEPTPAPTPAATSPPAASPPAPTGFRMPTLIGLARGDAEERIRDAGLTVSGVALVDGAEAADTVVGADPPAGVRVVSGDSVSLRVASGRQAVPAVSGLAVAEASRRLREAGFEPHASAGADDVVVTTSPSPGSVLAHGSPITVFARAAAPPTPTPRPTATDDGTPTPVPRPSASAPPDDR